MADPVLNIENLTKRFDEQDAIYDINLSVNEGEIVAVKGQKGSGKTTLLKLVAGIMVPTSGVIKILGEAVNPGEKRNAQKTGLMLQHYGVYGRLTLNQYLNFFRRLYGVPRERVEEVVRMAGLLDRQKEPLRKFSDNLRARVKLSAAMLHNPPVLLLDEPTSNLDLETTEILRRMIIKAAENGAAILIATSSHEEAGVLAHRIARMSRGRIESWESMEGSQESSGGAADILQTHNHLKVEKIPAKVNDRFILFNPPELTYIESQEGQSILHTADESFPCPLTLAELEEKLKPFGFFRSHRSYIVNLQRVREVIPWTRNSYSLILDDINKTSVPLSKNCVKDLEGILGM